MLVVAVSRLACSFARHFCANPSSAMSWTNRFLSQYRGLVACRNSRTRGLMNPGTVLPVSLLVSSARLLIERHLGLAWISGEISNFTRATSGHCYFVLKDARAQVRCVIYRQRSQLLDVVLKDGLSVEVRATPTIYEARGEFQLTVEAVRLAGLGALYEKFAALKAKLEAAGWFHADRKRTLPAFPRAVGIVTSPQAAALRDVLATLLRRLPGTPVIVYPTPVQGSSAAAAARSRTCGRSTKRPWRWLFFNRVFRLSAVWATRPISRFAISWRMCARPRPPRRQRWSFPIASHCLRERAPRPHGGARRS